MQQAAVLIYSTSMAVSILHLGVIVWVLPYSLDVAIAHRDDARCLLFWLDSVQTTDRSDLVAGNAQQLAFVVISKLIGDRTDADQI